MKKKLLILLLTALALGGCGNQTPSEQPSSPNSSEQSTNSSAEPSEISPTIDISETTSDEPPAKKDTYATVNSSYDVIYYYGTKNETFNLEKIDYSRVFNGKAEFKTSDNGIEINDSIVSLNENGIYTIQAYNKKNLLFTVKISVNEGEENRYNMPYLPDLVEYNLHSGKSSNIIITDNINLNCKNAGGGAANWHRISYDLPEEFSTNYSVECDVKFKDSADNTRWFGLVFRDQESASQKYPYYQFDFRRKTNDANSIELTYVYAEDQYSYPYKSSWSNGGPGLLNANNVVHMKLDLHDRDVFCELSTGDYTTSFTVTLPNISSGGFGFQCSQADVEVSNIKVQLDKTMIKASSADPNDSIVNIYDDKIDALKPHIIASGSSTDEIYGVGLDVQQYYVKVKNDKLYNINEQEMDLNLNDLFLETKSAYIPNIHVEDEESLLMVNDICSSYGIIDLTIWSSNEKVLQKAHECMSYARLGYIPTEIGNFTTLEEVGSVCRKAGKLYCNLIMIDSNLLTKDNVSKAVGLGYSIVANAKNGDSYSVIDGALSGCKLILANFNDNVQRQVELIYDNTVFNVDEKSSLVVNHTHSLLSVPYATGHRGSGNTQDNQSCDYPENTVESFKYAYDSGANAVEIDIHLTKDNKLAVIHNGSTKDYTDALHNYNVATTNLNVLQEIPLRTPKGKLTYDYHIPSYEEVLSAFASEKYSEKTMVVEIKDGKVETGKKAIEIAKEYGWYNRITLITFDSSVATQLRTYDPAVQVSYLGTVYRNNNEEYWTSVNSYLASGVGLASQQSTVSKEAIQEGNARGHIYWLWTFNRVDSTYIMTQILNGNVAFTTNYVSFFSDNKYKLTFDEEISLAMNETKELSATSITYVEKTNIENDVEIIVLSDNAVAEGNKITRTSDGTIYIVLKHKTTWEFDSTSTNFYIYSDLIEIK